MPSPRNPEQNIRPPYFLLPSPTDVDFEKPKIVPPVLYPFPPYQPRPIQNTTPTQFIPIEPWMPPTRIIPGPLPYKPLPPIHILAPSRPDYPGQLTGPGMIIQHPPLDPQPYLPDPPESGWVDPFNPNRVPTRRPGGFYTPQIEMPTEPRIPGFGPEPSGPYVPPNVGGPRPDGPEDVQLFPKARPVPSAKVPVPFRPITARPIGPPIFFIIGWYLGDLSEEYAELCRRIREEEYRRRELQRIEEENARQREEQARLRNPPPPQVGPYIPPYPFGPPVRPSWLPPINIPPAPPNYDLGSD